MIGAMIIAVVAIIVSFLIAEAINQQSLLENRYQLRVRQLSPSPTAIPPSFADPRQAGELWRTDSVTPTIIFNHAILTAIDTPQIAIERLDQVIRLTQTTDARLSQLAITAKRRLSGEGTPTSRISGLASDLLAAEDWYAAEYLLNRLVGMTGGDPRVIALLGTALEAQGRDGAELIGVALIQSPTDPTVNYAAAIFYRQRGDSDRAFAALSVASQADPTNPAVAVETATLYRSQGRVEDAALWLERAVALAPNDLTLHYTLCRFYADEVYQLDGAGFLAIQRALQRFPTDSELNAILGQITLSRGLREESRVALDRSLSIEPGNLRGRYYLGVWHERNGEADLARVQFLYVADRAPTGSLFKLLSDRALRR
jgi:Flp pilus assembly protein TadD